MPNTKKSTIGWLKELKTKSIEIAWLFDDKTTFTTNILPKLWLLGLWKLMFLIFIKVMYKFVFSSYIQWIGLRTQEKFPLKRLLDPRLSTFVWQSLKYKVYEKLYRTRTWGYLSLLNNNFRQLQIGDLDLSNQIFFCEEVKSCIRHLLRMLCGYCEILTH